MKNISNKKKSTIIIILVTITICILVVVLFKWINKININNIFQKYNLNIEETVAIYEIEK